jgi:ubiquinone/menaquinone biosynthesis C-methylase UbiE
MNLAELKGHWEMLGQTFPQGSSVTPTSRDPFLGQLEEDNVFDFLSTDCDALDIGCGDASHTVAYAPRCHSIIGLDVAASLIDRARQRVTNQRPGNASFAVGSVVDLSRLYPAGKFDRVISQRCLINLPDWEHQRDVLLQIHQILKPGGLFLMTEGFVEPLAELNAHRRHFGLPEIAVVSYNRNMERTVFEQFVAIHFDIMAVRDYGTYLYLSRILHPLAVRPEAPRHDSPINRAAMEVARVLPSNGFARHSYNLFYALRKRASATYTEAR